MGLYGDPVIRFSPNTYMTNNLFISGSVSQVSQVLPNTDFALLMSNYALSIRGEASLDIPSEASHQTNPA
uniref:Uncharacterized protein n=1 Tax=Candidatus Kentrum sp. TUN TaxID=2126343 RepID=A0A450ZXA9_9GAMM|nr:MAG: hypothetical protein BECKTUN1418D_GA0071000_108213 [Candidatus Kentron sp. TUN]